MSMQGWLPIAKKEEVKTGFELEHLFSSRRESAAVVADFFSTNYRRVYNSHGLIDYQIDTELGDFHIVSDSSVTDYNARVEGCELVTPVLKTVDIPVFIKLVEYLHEKGAYTNNSCGFHVHASHFAEGTDSFIKLIQHDYTRHDLIWLSCRGENNWCKSLPDRVARNVKKCTSLEGLKKFWYTNLSFDSLGNYDPDWEDHYNPSRYYGLNMHSYFQGKGVEFRYFEASMKADKLLAYIDLCKGLIMDSINSIKMRQYLYIDRPYDIEYNGHIKWKAEVYKYKLAGLWLEYMERMKLEASTKRILLNNFQIE